MSSTSSPITSREYKLTLSVDDKLYKDWKLYDFRHLQHIIEWTCKETGIKCSGTFKSSDQFGVKYMDTPDWSLYRNGWIFRIRRYTSEPHNEYTLKFRSPDRYYSASKNLKYNNNASTDIDNVANKFEEDITLDPFSSNFSPSCNVFSKKHYSFKSFKKLSDMWEGISDLGVSKNTPIVAVRGRQVLQEVWKGFNIKLGDDTYKIKVVLWWNSTAKSQEDLLFGEIMFRIKSPDEKYSSKTIVDAHNFYLKLNECGLNTGWVSPDGMTKTKYFYGCE
jgi:hypothetical protein